MSPAPPVEIPRERARERPLTVRDAAIAACATSLVVHAWLALEHRADQPLRAAAFAAAAIALGGIAYAFTRPSLTFVPLAAAALFAALLATYPVVLIVSGEQVDALGVATKAVEAAGLAASLMARREARSFGSADALAGAIVAVLLLSLGHTH